MKFVFIEKESVSPVVPKNKVRKLFEPVFIEKESVSPVVRKIFEPEK